MRDYIGIIIVTISMLRPGDCGSCGTLNFDRDGYNVGECASLTYRPLNYQAARQWYKDSSIQLKMSSSSKYHESTLGDKYILTIRNIHRADVGWYYVKCGQGDFTDYSQLKISASSDNLNCGRLNFENPIVYRGESASLIYKPRNAMAPIAWYKDVPEGLVLLYPNVNSRQSTKYKVLKTDETINLTISEVDLADAGCYVLICGNLRSPSVTLQVVEPTAPSNPEFLDVDDSYNCSKCLPARRNVRMNVTCFVKGGSEPVGLNMFKSEELLSSVYRNKHTSSKTNTITYSFIPTNDDFDTVFKCTVKNPALQVKKVVTTKLYIKVDPESIDIKIQPTKENELGYVQCITVNSRPPITSLFYFKNYRQNSVNNTRKIQSGYTYNVTTTSWRKFTRRDNQASVKCCSESSPRVCSTEENLNVTFPPKFVDLSERSKESKENGDMVLVLTCDVHESNPKSFVEWKGVDNLPKQLVEEKYIDHTGTHGWKFTSSWKFKLTMKNKGLQITCEVKNTEFPNLELQKTYTADITCILDTNLTLHSPEVTIFENGYRNAYIGDDVALTCNVDSNPPSVISWSAENVIIEESNVGNKLDLHLLNVTMEQSQTYTCTARNGIGGNVSRDITLSVKVQSEKTDKQPSSETSSAPLVLPVIGGAAVLIIAVVAGVVFLTWRKKRNDAAPKRKETHQIEDEPRHEYVNPARNEPVHNDMPESNEKELENAPEYACVIPKANRKDGTDQLTSEEGPVYAGVIPKAKRKQGTDQLKSEDTPEYACVIPKAERKHGTDQRKPKNASPKSQGNTLVYAELNLNLDSKTTARKPLTKQYEPTEYVAIDFTKTGAVKIDKEEMKTGAVKIEHEQIVTGSVKEEDKDI